MKSRLSLLLCSALAALSLSTLTACNDSSSELIVSYATMKVIERGDSLEDQLVRADKIREIATDVKALLAGEKVTISSLEATVREQIQKLRLSPADAFLADALIRQVVTELQQRVGIGILDPDKRYKVSVVLDWVINATAYGGSYSAGNLSGTAAAGA